MRSELTAPTRRGATDGNVVIRDTGTGRSGGDRFFQAVLTAGGSVTLSLMGLIAVFLVWKAWPALRQSGPSFLTRTVWDFSGSRPSFGIGSMLVGTVVIALIAMAVAVPLAIGAAVWVNEYLPTTASRYATILIDLLAAVPSLVFGMWGLLFLQPHLIGVTRFLALHLGWIPILHPVMPIFGSSLFMCGLVVSLMVLPIVASVARESMAQVPRSLVEGAYALGATRTSMVRHVLLSNSRPGLVGGSMLGLGRALGETMAVALILSLSFPLTDHILNPGGGSVAGLIALHFGEAGPAERSALVAAGLALFMLTLGVNMVARLVVGRSAGRSAGLAA